ncbi:MAG: N-acetyl-gamma-glutamyl-phosphate reductase [Phycisphaerales bacterium]|nr:N-acetyl-gamma-glutamyl-phosphate reductase [Phycisphaerales bacterium]
MSAGRGGRIRVALVGAAGYAGAEAIAMLLRHPGVELCGLFGSEGKSGAGVRIDALHPRLRGLTDLCVEAASEAAILECRPDAVMLATPHEASEALAPVLCRAGVVVLDLSAAFRLRDPAAYPTHYGFSHRHPELLREAVYGLAELNEEAIAAAQLIAVPGCYPTSVALALRPLVESALLDDRTVIVDSTSGVSGAGRSPSLRSLFCEVSQSPYGVLSHRHQPEMAQETGADIIFTPHLGPYDRGILSTMHATLHEGVTERDIRACLSARYTRCAFVRLLPEGTWPSVGAVERTNFCDMQVAVDPVRRHLVACSAIDNLVKGAAGQAVQCLNIRFGMDERLGIDERVAAHAAALRTSAQLAGAAS